MATTSKKKILKRKDRFKKKPDKTNWRNQQILRMCCKRRNKKNVEKKKSQEKNM